MNFAAGAGRQRSINVSRRWKSFKETVQTNAPDQCPTPHDWQTLRAQSGLDADGWAKWENRIERCATCDARRQRRVEWDRAGQTEG